MLISPLRTGQSLDPIRTASRKMAKTSFQLRKLG
jgi:hypothetical protein